MNSFKTYFQSEEFKKVSRDTTDSAVKAIFRAGAWGFLALKNFIVDIFKMAFGIKR